MLFSAAVAAMTASPALSPCDSEYASIYISARWPIFFVSGSDTMPKEERKSCGSVHAIRETGPAEIFQKDGNWCMKIG
jgi:hypothetical protein